MENKKVCRTCKENLFISNFTISNGYYRRDCKECFNAITREKRKLKANKTPAKPKEQNNKVESETEELIQTAQQMQTKLLQASQLMPTHNEKFNIFDDCFYLLRGMIRRLVELEEEADELNQELIDINKEQNDGT